MKVISQKDKKQAFDILTNGGILGVPTETVYGIASSLESRDGIEKLIKIKKRPITSDKCFTLMLPSVKDIPRFADISRQEANLSRRYFPGELTMIFNKNPDFKNYYFDNFNTIGIRIPAHKYMLELLEKTGPLLVTSANPRGETPCLNWSEFKTRMPKADAVIRGKSGNSLPSTILDIRSSIPHIIRQGGLLIVQYN